MSPDLSRAAAIYLHTDEGVALSDAARARVIREVETADTLADLPADLRRALAPHMAE
jgi:hypothetical protein